MKRFLWYFGYPFLCLACAGVFALVMAATTAYDVPAGTTTWGQALSPNRTSIVVTVHDADASLQTYLDGTRLDSLLLLRGQPYPYWGEIDSLNIVRPINTRGSVQLGAPGSRDAPAGGGAAKSSWSMTKIYDGHSLLTADTTVIAPTWGEADAGYIRLLHYSAGVTNGGVSPQYFFKTVLDGRWIPLRISVSGGAGVAGYMDIGDGTNYYQIILGFATDVDAGAISSVTPGDSIVVIVVPNGATAGTNELWGYSKKD